MKFKLNLFSLVILFLSVSQFIRGQQINTPMTYSESLNKEKKKVGDLLKIADDFNPFMLNWNYFPFSTNTTLSLGRGFSPLELDAIKQSPFSFEMVDSVFSEGALITNFDIEVAYNRNNLMEQLDSDIKLELNAFGFKANAFSKAIESTTFDETSLVFVVKARSEYGERAIKNFKLTENAKKILKRNSVSDFIKVYGTKIPVSERRGNSVYIICKISNISRSTKSEIERGIKASAGGLVFSFEFEAKFKKVINTANESGNFSCQILTTGGSGLNSLSDIMEFMSLPTTQSSFVDLLRRGIPKYFKQFNYTNSVPLGYYCRDYADMDHYLLWKVGSEKLSNRQIRILQLITRNLRVSEDILTKYSAIASGTSLVGGLLTFEQIRKIRDEIIPEVVRYQEYLSVQFKKFLREEPKDQEEIEVLGNVELPFLKGLVPKVEMRYAAGSETNRVTSLSILDDFEYVISAPYLSNVMIEYRILDDVDNAELRPLSLIYGPSKTPVNGSVVFGNDKVEIKSGFFISRKFKEDIANTAGLNLNPRVELVLTAMNTLGEITRKSILLTYAHNVESSSTVVYMLPDVLKEKTIDCNVDVKCPHSYAGQEMWNVTIEGRKFRKLFPNNTERKVVEDDAKSACRSGLLYESRWIDGWIKDCN